jgi:hypothetical protein
MAEIYPTSSSGESYSFSGEDWSDDDTDRRDAYLELSEEKRAEYDEYVAELEDLMSRGDEDGALTFLDAHPQLACRAADLEAPNGRGVEVRPRLWAAATYGCLRVMEYLVQRRLGHRHQRSQPPPRPGHQKPPAADVGSS